MANIKRLAISSHSLGFLSTGNSGSETLPGLYLNLEGQVLDIPFGNEGLKKPENWNYQTGHPLLHDDRPHTPFEDLKAGRVRDPVLRLEICQESISDENRPGGFAAPADRQVIGKLRLVVNNSEGIFRVDWVPLMEGVDPKDLDSDESYRLRYYIYYEGTDSLRQRLVDMAQSGSIFYGPGQLIGRGLVHIFPRDFSGFVLTSDIDQTYLNTDLNSSTGKVKTLFETSTEKETLPGMTVLYQELKRGFYYGGQRQPVFLKFISASPFFFRRMMFQKFTEDGIEIESIHLKDLRGVFNNMVADSWSGLANIGRVFEKGLPSLGDMGAFLEPYLNNFVDQTGYKLILLLKNRLAYPPGSREVLIGDNTETDFLIFALYKKIIENPPGSRDWKEFFHKFRFKGKQVLTQKQIEFILQLIEKLESRKEGDAGDKPQRLVPYIFIHQALEERDHEFIENTLGEFGLLRRTGEKGKRPGASSGKESPEGHSTRSRELTVCPAEKDGEILCDLDAEKDYLVVCSSAWHIGFQLNQLGCMAHTSLEKLKTAMSGRTLRNFQFYPDWFERFSGSVREILEGDSRKQ